MTAVSPPAGPKAGGTVVTITGTGFVNGATVSFGGAAATNVTVAGNGTTITATSPSGTTKVNVTVSTPGGTSSTSTADQFTYDAVPAVSKLSVTTGPQAGGTAVTITGTGFVAGSTTVLFGAVPATIVTLSATSIKVTSPPGTGVVDVTVTTPGGTSAGVPGDRFTYV